MPSWSAPPPMAPRFSSKPRKALRRGRRRRIRPLRAQRQHHYPGLARHRQARRLQPRLRRRQHRPLQHDRGAWRRRRRRKARCLLVERRRADAHVRREPDLRQQLRRRLAGRLQVFYTTAAELSAADKDAEADIYEGPGTPALISTGPVGGNGTHAPHLAAVSVDAGHAFFTTDERLTVDDDFAGEQDVYDRSAGGRCSSPPPTRANSRWARRRRG